MSRLIRLLICNKSNIKVGQYLVLNIGKQTREVHLFGIDVFYVNHEQEELYAKLVAYDGVKQDEEPTVFTFEDLGLYDSQQVSYARTLEYSGAVNANLLAALQAPLILSKVLRIMNMVVPGAYKPSAMISQSTTSYIAAVIK